MPVPLLHTQTGHATENGNFADGTVTKKENDMSNAKSTDSALVTLLGLVIGLPMAAGFIALVFHAFSTGLNSMVAALPTWALIGAFGCAALGAYKGWKAQSVSRLRLYGAVVAVMTFVLGGSMMFVGNTPAGSDVEARLTGMFNILPTLLAWFCVVSCVLVAFVPIESREAGGGVYDRRPN